MSSCSGLFQYSGSLPIAHALTMTLVLIAISYPFISHLSLASLGSSKGAGGWNLRVSLITNFNSDIAHSMVVDEVSLPAVNITWKEQRKEFQCETKTMDKVKMQKLKPNAAKRKDMADPKSANITNYEY
ncbi:hypothetical protein QQP08_000733 [Theobroma cacao]|nr:hypothetical protein QQP08_000733 [Theobroma cacao]